METPVCIERTPCGPTMPPETKITVTGPSPPRRSFSIPRSETNVSRARHPASPLEDWPLNIEIDCATFAWSVVKSTLTPPYGTVTNAIRSVG